MTFKSDKALNLKRLRACSWSLAAKCDTDLASILSNYIVKVSMHLDRRLLGLICLLTKMYTVDFVD